MKLIKMSSDHYIIVDESKQPVEGYYYDNFIKDIRDTRGAEYGQADHCWQITHSTQPLEGGNINYENRGKEKLLFDKIQQLSLSEVKELLREVDVEKMADEYANHQLKGMVDKSSKFECVNDFINGYNQALEDNKDRKYTEEDIRKAISETRKGMLYNKHYEDEYIQSLQPPISWDVEFVNGKLKLK